MEKDFDRWNRIKKATDAADGAARLYFREGEVWWVRLGKNIGYETDGKSNEFTRPVIVLRKYNQYSFLALPLTTAPKPNPYRLPIGTWTASRRSQRSRSCATSTASAS
jgi:mRNA interferase MazF